MKTSFYREGLNINTNIKKIKDTINGLGFDEKLVFFNVIFIFVPIFVSALTTLVLAIYILTKAENRRKIASVPFAFYLIIWAAVSLFAGLIHKNFLGDAAFIVYLSFIVFSMYTFMIMTRELSRRIIQLSAALGIAVFIIAVVEKAIDPADRTVSTFFNANYYGFMCELIILVSLYGLLFFKTCRWLYIASIASQICGLLISGCRSAWPGVLGGVIVMMFCLKKYRQLIVVLCAGAVGTVTVMIFPSIIPRFSSMDTTESLRFTIWKIAFAGFLKHPLIGQGFMGYWLLSHNMGRADQPHAHDILLNALDSYGTVGVILLAIFIVPAIICCIRKLRKSPICALVLGVVAAIAIHGITDDPILGMQTGIFSMTLLTLCGGRQDDEQKIDLPGSDSHLNSV